MLYSSLMFRWSVGTPPLALGFIRMIFSREPFELAVESAGFRGLLKTLKRELLWFFIRVEPGFFKPITFFTIFVYCSNKDSFLKIEIAFCRPFLVVIACGYFPLVFSFYAVKFILKLGFFTKEGFTLFAYS